MNVHPYVHPFAYAPPQEVIALAEHTARRSPCMKSKRGAVVYQHRKSELPVVMGIGMNGPPGNIGCDGSEACRRDCGVRCVHAEIRALHSIVPFQSSDLVHVKIGGNGNLVAGGKPSCVQCSKVILDLGIRGVWLYELNESTGPDANGEWTFYDSPTFHKESLKNEKVY